MEDRQKARSVEAAGAQRRSTQFSRTSPKWLALVAKRSELPCGCRGLLSWTCRLCKVKASGRGAALRTRTPAVDGRTLLRTQEPPPRAVCQSGASVVRCVRPPAGSNCQHLEAAFEKTCRTLSEERRQCRLHNCWLPRCSLAGGSVRALLGAGQTTRFTVHCPQSTVLRLHGTERDSHPCAVVRRLQLLQSARSASVGPLSIQHATPLHMCTAARNPQAPAQAHPASRTPAWQWQSAPQGPVYLVLMSNAPDMRTG